MSDHSVQDFADRFKDILVLVAEGQLPPDTAYIELCNLIDDCAQRFSLNRDTCGFARCAERIIPVAYPKAFRIGPLRLDNFPPEDLKYSYARSVGLCLGRAAIEGTLPERTGAKIIDSYMESTDVCDFEAFECGDRDSEYIKQKMAENSHTGKSMGKNK